MTLNNKSVADGFDFLLGGEDAAKAQPLVPSEMSSGPNLAKVTKMTSRKFAQTVLDVFDSLGGASWLLIQAQVDPKGFLELLKKMIPNSVQMGDLQGLTVRLIDQFGNEVHIDARGPTSHPASAAIAASGDLTPRSGQPIEIATGGTPTPEVKIQEMYE